MRTNPLHTNDRTKPPRRILSLRYLALALVAVAVPLAWWIFAKSAFFGRPKITSDPRDERVVEVQALRIVYPLDASVFPPDIAPTQFRWEDETDRVDRWTVGIEFNGDAAPMEFTSAVPEWTPPSDAWETIKQRSLEAEAAVTICGTNHLRPEEVLSEGQVSIRTSGDAVGAPIFYREVNLPFSTAVKNPAKHIRWRFGAISSEQQPPVVLEKMPVCGNCHSFDADGQTVSMDVDFANDKGSYAICPVSQEMLLDGDNIITWSDFRREDKKKTFGLLSQVSPDGRYVVSTVKDLSVFLAIDDDLAFSQLFFPVQGILCYYDRQTETFHELSGADDPEYVQSNPVWSPDGKSIVFARSEAYDVPDARVHELGLSVPDEVPEFVSGERTFLFDLYRIPFNEGQGGDPQPLRGASGNGKSNYFPKYSPDGKWIIFCQAASFMLLRPDSQLFIIPAEGGEARRLECNTDRMNSWHSWSPNGKWLVFSSKAYTPYTQLMLTHIDDQGHATPPVLLAHFTAPDMAANIPEFVNTSADAIKRISFDKTFFGDAIHINDGDEYARQGDLDRAIGEFEKAVQANPDNVYAYRGWSHALSMQGKPAEAEKLLRKARQIAPDDEYVVWQLGMVLWLQGEREEAERMYRHAISINSMYSPPYLGLAKLLLEQGKTEQGRSFLQEAIRIKPSDSQPYCLLGDSLIASRETRQAIVEYRKALMVDADCLPAMLRLAQISSALPGADPLSRKEAIQLATRACELTGYQRSDALIILCDAQAAAGNRAEAVSAASQALRIANQSGQTEVANIALSRLRQYGRQ